MDLEDPIFLQNLGRVTISFTLLDAALAAILHIVESVRKLHGFKDVLTLDAIARMSYRKRVDRFMEIASEFEKLGGPFGSDFFRQLKADLNGAAAERNRLIHDFWTVAVGDAKPRKVVKSLKADTRVDLYPTPETMRRLSDRIYDVRARLAPVTNEYMRLRREHAETQQTGPNSQSLSEWARRRKEVALATLRELEVRKRKDQLIETAAVRAVWSEHHARIRDGVLAMPNRLAESFANQPAGVIREKLAAEVEDVLRNCAESII